MGFVLIPRVVRSSWESSLCPERLPVLWHRQSTDWGIKLFSYFEDRRLLFLKYPHCSTLELVHLNPLIDGCKFCAHMNGMWGLLSDIWVLHEGKAVRGSLDQDACWVCSVQSIMSYFASHSPSDSFLHLLTVECPKLSSEAVIKDK